MIGVVPLQKQEELKVAARLLSGVTGVRLATEAVTAGLAFGSVLCWASACLVSTFRPENLGDAYWNGIPGLRTDNSGSASFVVAAICLATSEYLRLRRCRWTGGDSLGQSTSASSASSVGLMAQAVSKMVAILATGLVIYLSLNAITHPSSLEIHTTHLLSWPAEGTLRVMSLLLCTCAVAALRYLRTSDTVRTAPDSLT
jgi:hypothetical protein